ncbi:Arylsulphatase [Thozetella sp. PMI_491]|nr:Arylsulphatase [Thozetella sp. PMI_491]
MIVPFFCEAFIGAAFLALSVFSNAAAASIGTDATNNSQPNIIFILTDDQDVQMGSLDYMPFLKQHMIDQGTTYNKHYCTVSLCCPSRVSLWTGKAAHNTNVTDVQPPYGGYKKFVDQQLNTNYLPVWLQEAGYATYYVGKLFNTHTILNYNDPYAGGWDGNEFLLDPFQYSYLSPVFQHNHDNYTAYPGQYVTDLVANFSFGFLEQGIQSQKPFFLTIAPIAPHAEVTVDSYDPATGKVSATFSAPIPAARHEDLFPDAEVPRTLNFNPDEATGVSWVKQLEQLNDSQIAYNDDWYRKRLQALQAVDEMIDELFTRLENENLLDNTYIFYSGDNGFHISQHRLGPGKTCGIETDLNVPLIVRGPGIAKGASVDFPTTHTDLAPTILDLAKAPTRPDFDGAIINLVDGTYSGAIRQEHVNVETWFLRNPNEGPLGIDEPEAVDNTFKGLRLISDEYDLYYSVWCTNEYELYNMTSDPYQMTNLFLDGFPANGSCSDSTTKLASRLDGLMMVLKSCQGDVCRNPWGQLDSSGSISSFSDAMDGKYDDLFENQLPRVSYSSCEAGYIVSAEGPQFSSSMLQSEGGVGDPTWAMRT